MKRRLIWLIVGSLVILSLVLASCAPTPTPTPTTPTPTPITPTPTPITPTPTPAKEEVAPKKVAEAVVNALGRTVEKPRYGGVLTLVLRAPSVGFDDAVSGGGVAKLLTHEELLEGDWTRGPAGTGELSWSAGVACLLLMDNMVPAVAESWEYPDATTGIVHIRKGVKWQNKNPSYGRELTADDVAFSLQRWFFLPTSYGRQWAVPNFQPYDIEALDKYTLKYHSLPGYLSSVIGGVMDWCTLWPRDAGELFGDFTDWRNVVGSGPFILSAYVPGNSYTLTRNPIYWRKQPLYPEDQMPYLDGVKILIIPDVSTRLAALRTAKVDVLDTVFLDDARSLIKTNPGLKYKKFVTPSAITIGMRLDNPALPFYDKRVRHALAMAIDREAMKRDLYGGEAEILQYPTAPFPELMAAYVPLEKLPPSTQELFKYNPTKSKQLLAEAGYPQGFKTTVLTRPQDVDILSVIKEYWKAIGVELVFDIKEPAVYTSLAARRGHTEMIAADKHGGLQQPMDYWVAKAYCNASYIDTAETREAIRRVLTNMLDWKTIAMVWQDFGPYLIDMADYLQPPMPYTYTFWQPWVKDYHGEWGFGWGDSNEFPKYIWIDQDLKESMTGRK